MRKVALAAVLILVTIPAQADDRSECRSGIVMIQAEIARSPCVRSDAGGAIYLFV
ncbi:hypothetical protein FG93_00223 [Bosea sp. LC85]|uniref:hypothetical protein n=1 Tax=Bosea sp. LC85 TaxID=1502851 RepID=UPI0004E2CCB1|nr:hypothetical protein [Bosea sp. LC85]KFC76083.1 hypothetical protein FG93_00223 [Bosea sp. LC85]